MQHTACCSVELWEWNNNGAIAGGHHVLKTGHAPTTGCRQCCTRMTRVVGSDALTVGAFKFQRPQPDLTDAAGVGQDRGTAGELLATYTKRSTSWYHNRPTIITLPLA